MLARLPYGDEAKPVEEFNFEEDVDGTDHDKYLWMNAAWAYAARITDAFAKYGWWPRIRGVEGGGKVEGLPVHTFPTDDGDVAMKCPTEIAITDRREIELSNLGFLPLLHYKNTDYAVFIGAQSCQKPKTYFDPAANANAALSAKFNYILCVVALRPLPEGDGPRQDRLVHGSRSDCETLAERLDQQLRASPTRTDAGDEIKAQHPLAEAKVEVREVTGKPGWYEAVAYLRPHFQLEALTTSMRLVAEVPKKSRIRESRREPALSPGSWRAVHRQISSIPCPQCGRQPYTLAETMGLDGVAETRRIPKGQRTLPTTEVDHGSC